MPRNSSVVAPSAGRSRRLGMLSTFPPRRCGLATFAAALAGELAGLGEQVVPVAVNDGRNPPPLGWHQLLNGDRSSVVEAAATLSRCDVVIIQHEYGLYGGLDGEEILDVLELLEAPTVIVFHSVPVEPTSHQRQVLTAVADRATRAVVMTEAARTRLLGIYQVDAHKVAVVPHGASTPSGSVQPALGADRPQLLTWGLLGPGKGIEHMIRAMDLVARVHPEAQYTVAGATHPNVLERDGDAYRQSLVGLAQTLGLAQRVHFDDTYRSVPTLMRFVQTAAVVILPYDSRDQVTSGVLVDAVAAGRPVVATAFPHAVELLSAGAGIVVPHADPAALAEAVGTILSDPSLWGAMSSKARHMAPTFSWTAVASSYVALCDEVAADDVVAVT